MIKKFCHANYNKMENDVIDFEAYYNLVIKNNEIKKEYDIWNIKNDANEVLLDDYVIDGLIWEKLTENKKIELVFEDYKTRLFIHKNYNLNFKDSIYKNICERYCLVPSKNKLFELSFKTIDEIKNDNNVMGAFLIKFNENLYELYEKRTFTYISHGYFFNSCSKNVSIFKIGNYGKLIM
jgi:hypothetical protein